MITVTTTETAPVVTCTVVPRRIGGGRPHPTTVGATIRTRTHVHSLLLIGSGWLLMRPECIENKINNKMMPK